MKTRNSFIAMTIIVGMAVMLTVPMSASAEQVTKENTITIAGGLSNAVVNVECYARGVGKPQANEIMKVALYSPSATTTTKVDFAVQEVDTTTFTSIASQDYTAGAYTYLNNAPFYKFVTGIGGASSTNFSYVPYMAKSLRISLWQNKTNAASVATSYTYQVITR